MRAQISQETNDRFSEQLATFQDDQSLNDLFAEVCQARTKSGKRIRGLDMIGKDRACDLAVNVVLPFYHALNGVYPGSVPSGDPLGFYRSFGKLQDNELIREMTVQLFDPAWPSGSPAKTVNSARRQQGLLRLHAVLTGAS